MANLRRQSISDVYRNATINLTMTLIWFWIINLKNLKWIPWFRILEIVKNLMFMQQNFVLWNLKNQIFYKMIIIFIKSSSVLKWHGFQCENYNMGTNMGTLSDPLPKRSNPTHPILTVPQYFFKRWQPYLSCNVVQTSSVIMSHAQLRTRSYFFRFT